MFRKVKGIAYRQCYKLRIASMFAEYPGRTLYSLYVKTLRNGKEASSTLASLIGTMFTLGADHRQIKNERIIFTTMNNKDIDFAHSEIGIYCSNFQSTLK